ncbi:MAG: thioredoxin domain-containing protein [Bdellovibrionota bacterium]
MTLEKTDPLILAPRKNRSTLGLIITSLLGIVDSLWLLYVHWNFETAGQACTISSKVSCEVIRYKQYSEWFSIPVPVYSAIFYLLFFGLALRVRRNRNAKDRRYIASLILFSIAALVSTLYFGLVSWFRLEMLCIYCSILYVLSFLNVGFSWNLWRAFSEFSIVEEWIQDVVQAFNHKKSFLGGMVLIAGILGVSWVFSSGPDLANRAQNKTESGVRSTGNPNANIKIVVFSDFQCPACKLGAQMLSEVEDVFSHKIEITYKFYPLDPSCNERARFGSHYQACAAAKAAYCASLQGHFWRFHDQFFDQQDRLGKDLFEEVAKKESLDMKQFENCISDDQTHQAVVNDIQEGNELEVNATPSIYVNGRRYTGPLKFSSFKKVIESFD